MARLTPEEQQLTKECRRHAAAMRALNQAVATACRTTGTVAGLIERMAGEDLNGGPLYHKADAAVAALDAAYTQLAAVFDDLPV